MTCPDCEYHKRRAQIWRHQAYKLGGKPLPWEPNMTDLRKAAEMTPPEALRLADLLLSENAMDCLEHSNDAATELRRLYEENQTLRQALAQPEQWKTCRHCGFDYKPPKADKWFPLEQPEQEPVAWLSNGDRWFCKHENADEEFKATAVPLYKVPPKREWVGLTDEEQQELHDKWQKRMDGWGSFYQAVEQALKEKNT